MPCTQAPQPRAAALDAAVAPVTGAWCGTCPSSSAPRHSFKMKYLRDTLCIRLAPGRQVAAALVQGLPFYQVALWPDGWDLLSTGAVAVRDTHAMAEARRWYLLAERNCAREDVRRVMTIHGVFVPRTIVDMAERCFPSEEAASVAMQLVAGDWIRQRRRQLLAAPEAALAERALAWSGSRYKAGLNAQAVRALVRDLVGLCITERAIPPASFGIEVRPEDGYGIRCYSCRVLVGLDSYARSRLQEQLETALIPWNRAVVRQGTSVKVISMEVRSAPPR